MFVTFENFSKTRNSVPDNKYFKNHIKWLMLKTLLGTQLLIPCSFLFQMGYLIHGYYATEASYITWVSFCEYCKDCTGLDVQVLF